MKLSLPANISKLRKEHSMTQEQLAEVLGVTFASVSKGERGVATPELNMKYDKGVELLKQNNPCRMNHPLIGQTLASSCNDPEGALPYLSMALLDLTVIQMEVVMGYLNVFCKTKDYHNALALVDWALAFHPGLKNSEKRSYMDKNEAFLWAIRADIQLSLGNKEEVINSLHQAKNIASRFLQQPLTIWAIQRCLVLTII